MDIGKPQRIVKVEPLVEPVPRERPAREHEREREREAEKVPALPRRSAA